jgi:DNA-binding response OmpR family regulator
MNTTRLLVIEDELPIANLIKRAAEDEEYEVHHASGMLQIPLAYTGFQPDVIILDIMMPDMDGVEVLQFLHAQFSRSRIILLSGSDALSRRITESLGKGLGLQIVANLSKPFRIQALKETLRQLKLESSTLPDAAMPLYGSM